MILTGYARQIAGDLDPGQIIDAEAARSGDPAELAAACLAAVDPSLAERVREGDLLVVDGALAGGAGAEVAVLALQALGFAAVICKHADAELAALGAIYGLPLLSVAAAPGQIGEGALLRIDLERGQIEAEGRRWSVAPLDSMALAAVRRGQLLARMRRVVEDEGFAE